MGFLLGFSWVVPRRILTFCLLEMPFAMPFEDLGLDQACVHPLQWVLKVALKEDKGLLLGGP